MARVFFTADSHFGHPLVLSPRVPNPRPFVSVEEHDRALVELWNAVVSPRDTVWHLGDFAYRCSPEHARRIFGRLNGRKLLVRGNHDKLAEGLSWAEPVRDVAQVAVPDPAGGSRGVWLSHYAHRVWPRMHRGDLHLYGHSHGSVPGTAASLDVGVDCWGYAPVDLDRILERMAETASVETGGGDP